MWAIKANKRHVTAYELAYFSCNFKSPILFFLYRINVNKDKCLLEIIRYLLNSVSKKLGILIFIFTVYMDGYIRNTIL